MSCNFDLSCFLFNDSSHTHEDYLASEASEVSQSSSKNKKSQENKTKSDLCISIHKSNTTCLLSNHRLIEKYCSPNTLEKPLRIIFIGHNPSNKSWEEGHYYANPSNRFWFLLKEIKMIPHHYTCS